VIKRILHRALERLPFEMGSLLCSPEDRKDYGRALEEYASLLPLEEVSR
jgi:hypothetical protein